MSDSLNIDWDGLTIEYNKYQKNRNIEVWEEKYKSLTSNFSNFEAKLIVFSRFEDRIHQAILNDDKKFLKILKNDNLNDIIEKVIKSN